MAAKKKASKRKTKKAVRKIAPKKKRFAQEYPIDCNATQAAIRAGYSEKTAYSMGHQLLKDPQVMQVIEKTMEKASEGALLSVKTVLKNIEDVRSRAKEDNEKQFELKALDMQARHVSLYNDKIDLNENKTVTLIIGGLEDDE